MFRKLLKKYLFLLGIILFIIILFRTNTGEIFQNFKNIKSLYLIISLGLVIPMFINKSFCWHYILRKQDIKYNFKDSFLMYWVGTYMGVITPGRLGELSKAIYLTRDGHSMGKSMVGIVLDRISDFAFLLTFVIIGSLFFISSIQKEILILILGIIIFIILLIFFWKIGLIKWGTDKIINFLLPQKYQKSWNVNLQDFIDGFKIFKLKNYLMVFIISAFSWTFYYLQVYFLAKGANINISFLYLAITVTITGFITLIPVSIFGIGIRDAALILALSPLMIPKEQIIVFSTLILSISLFTSLIGLICWLIKPLKFK